MGLAQRFAATPPFFISSQQDVPSIESLSPRRPSAQPAAAGTVLMGDPGSAGVARGRARVVLDPADACGLQPGEILVAPLTDPPGRRCSAGGRRRGHRGCPDEPRGDRIARAGHTVRRGGHRGDRADSERR
jgi:hypothetical protein